MNLGFSYKFQDLFVKFKDDSQPVNIISAEDYCQLIFVDSKWISRTPSSRFVKLIWPQAQYMENREGEFCS